MVSFALLPFLLFAPGAAGVPPVSPLVAVPAGTPLWMESDKRVRLRMGEEISARLQYAMYAEDRLVLPKGTLVQGTIVELVPEHAHRVEARLRGDFTPFSRPVVQFRRAFVNGAWIDLPVGRSDEGAAVIRLTPPPPQKGGLLRREWRQGVGMVKDRLRVVTAPGKADRLKDLLYSQLPYHPQNVPEGTIWTADTTSVFSLGQAAPAAPAATADASAAKAQNGPKTWTLQAYLAETVSSESTRTGAPLRAVVAQPVLGADGEVEVPQGTILEGQVTHARPARRFGRAGELRFDFSQMRVPGQAQAQQVQTSVQGVDAAGGANLSLDREGQVQPKPKDKIVVPLILLTLAARPLDNDGRGDNVFAKNAVASNSVGLVGFIVGTAGGWRNVAAGIGYYGSAIAIWNRWIKRGEETKLRKDTRIVLQTTARRSQPMGTR